ncbi:MAG: J domain-containing protein [Spirochaetes bacterium]|nr:J domain-containing protein [Spirochaetota bacterium]
MLLEKAYEIFGLSGRPPLAEVKSRYKTLVKRCHPDIVKGENDAIRTLNIAYETILEHSAEAPPAAKLSPSLEEVIKGLKLAMKRFAGTLQKKRRPQDREADTAELAALLAVLESQPEESEEYLTAVSFIRNVLRFAALPQKVRIVNAKDKKAYFLYNDICKQTERSLEEAFARLDGIRRRTSLWRYYLEKSREEYRSFRTINAPAFASVFDFFDQFAEDIEFMVDIFARQPSMLTYKDFFALFSRSRIRGSGK